MKKKTTKKTPVKRGEPTKRHRAMMAKLKAGKPVKAARKRPIKRVVKTAAPKKKAAKKKPTVKQLEVIELARKRCVSVMHYSRCNVCKHLEVGEIERLVIDWKSLDSITRLFKGFTSVALGRHVQAAGLDKQRDDNYLRGLDLLISDAHVRGVKIKTEQGLIQALKLKAATKGDLVQKYDISGNIIFKSDDELTAELNNIFRPSKASA